MNVSEVSRVAVIGGGTMGPGIAGTFAQAGCEVGLVDLTDDLLRGGMERLRQAQAVLVEAGLLLPDGAADALGRVRPTVRLEAACEGADLVVEAITEDLELKKEMFGRFGALCPAQAVLATNTSGLSITEIARGADRPDRVAGMHFWNPPHIIPLVEVTRGEATADATADLLVGICRRLGKRPILVRHDIPGFVGNRLQFAVMREALHLLSEGVASAEDIDTAMTAGPGLRYGLMGPLRTADLGGLDVFSAISRYLFAELNSSTKPSAILSELVGAGKLGAKSGEGIYTYSSEALDRYLTRRDRVLLKFLDVLNREEGTGDA